MRHPDIWSAIEIKEHPVQVRTSNGSLIPARPLPHYGIWRLWRTFKTAWGVLTGKYDALDWEE